RRGEQLMPGGITPAAGLNAPKPGTAREVAVRDAADVKGRLSSFQRGVKRARHSRDQPAQAVANDAPQLLGGQPLPAGQPSGEEQAWAFTADGSGPPANSVRKGGRRGRHRAGGDPEN